MAQTLADIAAEAGTSISTVSRVLAGGAVARRISEPTRRRVTDAAARLGYRPNLIARSLRTRRSNTVALLVSDIANPWFGRLASLVEQALHDAGYSLILCNSGEDAAREAEYLRLLPQKNIDGLVLVPVVRTSEALRDHLPQDFPLVLVDRPIPGVCGCVASDQHELATLLCDALAARGVRRICLVGGPADVVTHSRRGEVVSSRFEVIGRHEGPAQRETGVAAWAAFTADGSAAAADAVVCTNNFLGQGVLDAAAATAGPPVKCLGLFDELPMMSLLPIPIAAALQDVPALAQACVAQLLPRLRGDAAPPNPTPPRPQLVTNRAFDDSVG
ncbi:MAG TPA: LacI family DNA-binding transcriptional regulator [Tepidisphaeraceae bacterium]|nr:LacI family DNA-binding transcriptional regulator [Tepidisphaeraceae bacterium]